MIDDMIAKLTHTSTRKIKVIKFTTTIRLFQSTIMLSTRPKTDVSILLTRDIKFLRYAKSVLATLRR